VAIEAAGNAISLIGTSMRRFSVGWLARELSRSPMARALDADAHGAAA
jgi:hypothetical protein